MSQLITTYLQDHLAGSTAGIESFDRVAEGHSDEAVRSVVAALADEIPVRTRPRSRASWSASVPSPPP